MNRDLAIVLKSVAFEERHRIIHALTERYGRISAIARNSIHSRRFGGTLELFCASEWLFSDRRGGSELYSLNEVNLRRSFDGLRKDFGKLSMASAFNELMLRIAPESEPCPELFRLHVNALAALEEANTVARPADGSVMLMAADGASESANRTDIALLNGYIAKLLKWSGIQPRFDACLKCGLPLVEALKHHAELQGLVADAGWACGDCLNGCPSSGYIVSPLSIFDFQKSMGLPIRKVLDTVSGMEEDHRGMFKFLEALLVYHVPGLDKRPLKSLRFLDQASFDSRQSMPPPHQESQPRSQLPPL